eukprot:jgi/Botrbrau1/18034/Bobra.0062s0024.1
MNLHWPTSVCSSYEPFQAYISFAASYERLQAYISFAVSYEPLQTYISLPHMSLYGPASVADRVINSHHEHAREPPSDKLYALH